MKLRIDRCLYLFQGTHVFNLLLYNHNIDIKLWLNEITIYAR